MSGTSGNQQSITEQIKEYIATRIELGKLTITERVILLVASFMMDALTILGVLLVFFFGSLALAFYLGEALGSHAAGFGVLALFYLLLTLAIRFLRGKALEKSFHKLLLKRVFPLKK